MSCVPTVKDVTDPFAAFLVPVPHSGVGICAVCHRGGQTWPTCWSCKNSAGQVTRPCKRVMPISHTPKSGQLYHMLTAYKGNQPNKSAAVGLVALLARQLDDHAACVGPWDVITHVPSSGRHKGLHPLAKAMGFVPWLNNQHDTLVQRGAGALGHNTSSDDAFVATKDVRNKRVMIVDDTWTTGAAAQSVASTLALAGADIVGIMPIGRVISPSPDYPDEVEWWATQRQLRFTFGSCCVH